ncbi:hypothetical protein M9H77_35433 [Catharanthus roseus]|uniref:Uncharacterized protein n=1 Tax=Catharanthus roseus TaxID=4058 RepID=A0ACB9ZPB1_CATRO|nr:hypothetical protein M9H77_35433 [Catharanthus roseus]
MHVILVWTCTGSTSHVETWLQWRLRVRDGPALAAEVLSYPSDEYIIWYWGITQVYIGNPANRYTRSHEYQSTGVDRRMMTSILHEVDDMASVVIQEPPIDPSQMAVFAKKVQTIIRRCMVSIGGTLGCTQSQHDIQQTFPVQSSHRRPREHVPDRGARGVKRGARRQPGRGAGSGRPPVPPFPDRHERVDAGHDLPHFNHHIPHLSCFSGFAHPLLRAQPVHLHCISLYRRHLHMMKRSGQMTWIVYSIMDSGMVLHIRQQNIPISHDTNTTTLSEYITAVTQMISDEPSMLYSIINKDDDEGDGSDGDDAISSQSESDDDNDPEEEEFQTPLNPVILSTR